MKRSTWLLLSLAVVLAAASPALADDRSSGDWAGTAGLKAMWMDLSATVGGWLGGLVQPDRGIDRELASRHGDLGSTLDPDGYRVDDTSHLDPDGQRATGEGGPDMDPNG